MAIPAKPTPGQPVAPFVRNSSMWSQLLDMLAAWRRGEFDQPPVATTKMSVPLGRNDETTPMIPRHEVRAFGDFDQPPVSTNDPSTLDRYYNKPIGGLVDAEWHTNIGESNLLTRSILKDGTAPVRSARYIPVHLDNMTDEGAWVMFDPIDMTKLKRSKSGVYKIIAEYPDRDVVVVDTYMDQPKWLYTIPPGELAVPDVTNPGVFTANCTLWDLDRNSYATNTTVTFPNSEPVAGMTGFCTQAGNFFYSEDEVGIPFIRFRTTDEIIDHVVAAEVVFSKGNAIDPDNSGAFLTEGSVVNVHDPNNLFSDVETDATGIAYLRPYRPDDVETAGIDEEIPLRWEIESVSLPINKIRAKITACLLSSDAGGTGEFGADPVNFTRSTHPNVDIAPEWTETTPGEYTVAFTNPFKLNAILNSYVILERVTNLRPSEPLEWETPKTRSSTTVEWQVVSVEMRIARNASFTKASGEGNFNLLAVWDGYDPTVCGAITTSCEFDCSCLQTGDKVIASYDPEANIYRIDRSASGLLGQPVTKTLAYGDIAYDGGCGITYTSQSFKVFPCGSTSNAVAISPTMVYQPVVISVYETAAGIVTNYGAVQVCDSIIGGASLIPYTDCEVIEPPCDEGECIYRWSHHWQDQVNGAWIKVQECPSEEGCTCTGPPIGYPADATDTERKFPCSGA